MKFWDLWLAISAHLPLPLGRLKLPYLARSTAYLEFFADTLHSASLPNSPRPLSAALRNCPSNRGRWLRVSREIRGNLVCPSWTNVTPVNQPGQVVCQGVAAIGAMRFPHYL